MEKLQKEISKIENKIVKLDTQLNEIQEQIFINIKKMSEFTEETATVGNVTFQSEIIAKYQRQKYNVNTKIVKLNRERMILTNHIATIEFN